ncbi:MAG: thioredoxin family protein [Armatimonadota bacterium]
MMKNQWKIVIVVILVLAVIAAVVANNNNQKEDTPCCADISSLDNANNQEKKVKKNISEVDETSLSKEEAKAVEEEQTEEVAAAKVDEIKAESKEIKETVKPKAENTVEKTDSKPAAAQKNETKKSPAKLPTLIELGAEKCMPCKMMKPIIAELEKDYKGKLNVVFYDVWKDPSAAEKYNIQTIPTQVFLDSEGKEIFRHVGFFSKEDILATFEEHDIKLD